MNQYATNESTLVSINQTLVIKKLISNNIIIKYRLFHVYLNGEWCAYDE